MNTSSEARRLRSVGWLALVIAASAAVLIVLRVTRVLELYCDWTSPCLGLLIAQLPTYLAMLGVTLPLWLIVSVLQGSVASRELRASAWICAGVASSTYILMAVAAYDSMWASYASTSQLEAPRFTPVLPPSSLAATSVLWPVLLGASVVLTNLALATLQLSRALVGLGVLAGFALVAFPTFGHEQVTALYVASGLIMVWSGALAAHSHVTGHRTLNVATSVRR